jgi:hypothetical protein
MKGLLNRGMMPQFITGGESGMGWESGGPQAMKRCEPSPSAGNHESPARLAEGQSTCWSEDQRGATLQFH